MNNNENLAIGTLYVTGISYLKGIINIIQSIVLARILMPEDFGIIALGLLFVSLFKQITDLNTPSVFLQKQKEDKKTLSTFFFIEMLHVLIVLFLAVIASPIISKFYDANLIKIVVLLIVITLGNKISSIPYYLLLKRFKIKKLQIFEISAIVLKAFITIILAFFGFGFWSLPYGEIPAVALMMFLLYRDIKWRPSFKYFDFVIFKSFINYGKFLLLSGIVAFITSNINKFLLGTFMSLAALGFYSKSRSLLNEATLALGPVFNQVIFPLCSKFQKNKAKLSKIYMLFIGNLYAILGLLTCIIFINAKDAIWILLGEKWLPMVPLVKIMTFLIMLGLFPHSKIILKSIGRMKTIFRINLILLISTLVISPVLIFYLKEIGAAAALIIVSAINAISAIYVIKKIMSISIRRIIFAPTLAMLITLILFSHLNLLEGWNIFVRFAVNLLLPSLFYCTLVILLKKKYLSDLKYFITLLRRKEEQTL